VEDAAAARRGEAGEVDMDGPGPRAAALARAGLVALLMVLAGCGTSARSTLSTAEPPLEEAVPAWVLLAKTARVYIKADTPYNPWARPLPISELRLHGVVQIGRHGVHADLNGSWAGYDAYRPIRRPIHVIVMDSDVYLEQGPDAWLRLAADGEWPFSMAEPEWAALDFVIEALHYVANPDMLRGLQYIRPGRDDLPLAYETVANVDGLRFRGTLSEAQQHRFVIGGWGSQRAVDIFAYVDPDGVPRSVQVNMFGTYLSQVDISFHDWGTPLSIGAPSAATVVDGRT
jgi:hypothetical protein